jgi:hypothetical protein
LRQNKLFTTKASFMKKCILLLGFVALLEGSAPAQGVSIKSGTNLFIGAGGTVSLDSLVLRPTSNFNITGTNSETRGTTVVHALSKPYIKRVYRFGSTTLAFMGAITIYYRDAELNAISESVLTLNIHNGSSWNAYTGGVTRNSTSNYVATTGLSGIALNELTLASNTAPLTMNAAAVQREVAAAISVYPNPVQQEALVQVDAPESSAVRLQLYDSKGGLLLVQEATLTKGTNQVRINMSSYAKGSYTLLATWGDNNKAITIVKQ